MKRNQWVRLDEADRSMKFHCSGCGGMVYWPQPTRGPKPRPVRCPYPRCPWCGEKTEPVTDRRET